MQLAGQGAFALQLVDSYYKAGAADKGKAIIEKALGIYDNELGYFFALDQKLIQTKDVNETIQRDLFYLQRMQQIARSNGDTELAKKITDISQLQFNNYSGI